MHFFLRFFTFLNDDGMRHDDGMRPRSDPDFSEKKNYYYFNKQRIDHYDSSSCSHWYWNSK